MKKGYLAYIFVILAVLVWATNSAIGKVLLGGIDRFRR